MVRASIPSNHDIQSMVWEAIRKTINKFRENPYYCFTEADIITYSCQSLNCTKLEVVRDNRRVYCVHREYPTNFRYDKDRLLDPGYQPYPLNQRRGTRGNFDLAVLNPEFAKKGTLGDIVNKNVRDLEAREQSAKDELLFAVEYKYIINSSRSFEREVQMDNTKLKFALKSGAMTAVNLVFCNTNPKHRAVFRDAVLSADPKVISVFVMSYYEENTKRAPVPETNSSDPKIRNLIGAAPNTIREFETGYAQKSSLIYSCQ